jgi:signal transduction histidine kinase
MQARRRHALCPHAERELLPACVVAARLEEGSVLYAFVGAFVAVAVAFLIASAGTFVSSRDIDTAAQDLLGNALPSVMELMHARTAQRRLDVDIEVLTWRRAARGQLFDELVAARSELDTTLSAAMATPYYPGEGELYTREVQPRLTALDRAIEEVRAAVRREPGNERRFVAALSVLDAAGKDLDSALSALEELNHMQAVDAAWRIVRTRAQSVRLALYLEAASAAVALGAAFVAVRGGRRFARDARRRIQHESERAAELDVLAQRVAHDLMSPLAAVALSLGSIQHAHPDPDTARAVDRARRALERSRHMVQGIYTFSGSGAKPTPGATAPLRATALDAADELLATEGPNAPTLDVQSFDEAEVAMDRAVLGVVFANLLSNASKFSRGSPVRRVTVRADADDRRVHVEIEDTGPGVPPGMEQAIFEPYRRAPGVSQPGLGLGLATVKRLVIAHGGRLGVRNAPSGGAVFWFDLPRARERRPEARPPTEEREAPLVH